MVKKTYPVIVFLLSILNSIHSAFIQSWIIDYSDDIMWVYWASSHSLSSLLHGFPGYGIRPMMNLWYIIEFNLFGMNTFWYYSLNGVLFGIAMVFLYKIILRYTNEYFGVFGVIIYLLLDHTFFITWKINYISTVGELFFMLPGIYFWIRYFEGFRNWNLIYAMVLSFMAFMSKEPAIFIIPCVIIVLIWLHAYSFKYKSTLTKAVVCSNILYPAILLMVIRIFFSNPIKEASNPLIYLTYLDDNLTHQFKSTLVLLIVISGLFWYYNRNMAIPITIFIAGLLPLGIISLNYQQTYLAELNIGLVILISMIGYCAHREFKVQPTLKSIAVILMICYVFGNLAYAEVPTAYNYKVKIGERQTGFNDELQLQLSNGEFNYTELHEPKPSYEDTIKLVELYNIKN